MKRTWSHPNRGYSINGMATPPESDKELRIRLAIVLHELDMLLNLAAARALPVILDTVERETDRAPGVIYTTVIDTGGVR